MYIRIVSGVKWACIMLKAPNSQWHSKCCLHSLQLCTQSRRDWISNQWKIQMVQQPQSEVPIPRMKYLTIIPNSIHTTFINYVANYLPSPQASVLTRQLICVRKYFFAIKLIWTITDNTFNSNNKFTMHIIIYKTKLYTI